MFLEIQAALHKVIRVTRVPRTHAPARPCSDAVTILTHVIPQQAFEAGVLV